MLMGWSRQLDQVANTVIEAQMLTPLKSHKKEVFEIPLKAIRPEESPTFKVEYQRAKKKSDQQYSSRLRACLKSFRGLKKGTYLQTSFLISRNVKRVYGSQRDCNFV